MITIDIYRDSVGFVCGCEIVGHAGLAEAGQDIVCSAVSVLTYTTAAALQQLLKMALDGDMVDGRMKFFLTAPVSDRTQLLFEAMLIGLQEIAKQYPERVRISEKRR